MKNKDKIINLLLERIATLEYEVERLEQENAVLKTLVVNKDSYTYGIR